MNWFIDVSAGSHLTEADFADGLALHCAGKIPFQHRPVISQHLRQGSGSRRLTQLWPSVCVVLSKLLAELN